MENKTFKELMKEIWGIIRISLITALVILIIGAVLYYGGYNVA